LKIEAKLKTFLVVKKPTKFTNYLRVISVPILIALLSFEGGIISSSKDLILMFNTNDKNFEGTLTLLGLNNYVTPEKVDAKKGKNIIVISLESFEKGFLHDKYSTLTPNLQRLKHDWNYYDIKQNSGSKWTSGSLYTY